MLSFLEFIEESDENMLTNILSKYKYVHKQGAKSEQYTLTVDNRNTARDNIAAALKKAGIRFEIKQSSKSSFDPIFVGSTTIVFKPAKTGSDAKTTQMQELTSAWIFRRVLNDNVRYKEPSDITNDPKWKTEVVGPKGMYPTVDDEWIRGFFAQQEKMLAEFSNSKFTEFNRDGGFMDWITKLVKDMGIRQKDTWNPADIWLVNNENEVRKEIVDALGKVKIVTELNAIMRKLYNDRRLVGVSLKKISGKQARYEEINVKEIFGLDSNYGFKLAWGESRFLLSTDDKGKFSSQDMTIVAKAKSSTVKFQIKQNDSNKRSNLKFEPTQKGAGSARLGKVPLDMFDSLAKEYGIKFVNNHRTYPDDAKRWAKASRDYSKKFMTVNRKINTGVASPDEFINSITRAFLSGEKKNTFVAISKLMQLDFLYEFLAMTPSNQEEVITDMVFLAMKKGKQFGPHGKLYALPMFDPELIMLSVVSLVDGVKYLFKLFS